jgi:hypothetical protein
MKRVNEPFNFNELEIFDQKTVKIRSPGGNAGHYVFFDHLIFFPNMS